MADILSFTRPVNRETEIRLRFSSMLIEAEAIAKLVRIPAAGTPDDLACALDDIALIEECSIELFSTLGEALDADMGTLREKRRALFEEAFEAPLNARKAEWDDEARDRRSGWSDFRREF